MNKIYDEYCYMEEQIVSNLKGNLMKCQFYKSNYGNISNVVQSSQKLIKGYIQSRKNEIIDEVVHKIIDKNESNIKTIERLKNKNQFIIDDDGITDLIDLNKKDLTLKINQEFGQALHELVKITVKKKSKRTLFRRIIKQNTIKEYPNGMRDETGWKTIRVEKLSFKKIFTETFDSVYWEEIAKYGC